MHKSLFILVSLMLSKKPMIQKKSEPPSDSDKNSVYFL